MKIIAFNNKGGCGKTTTLKILYSLLTGDFSFSQFYFYRENNNDINDISAMFEYKNKRLGITTLGDSEKDLKRPFEEFKQKECDLVVCACRSRNTKNGANSYIKSQSKEIIWIKKAYLETCNAIFNLEDVIKDINLIQAKALKEEIVLQLR